MSRRDDIRNRLAAFLLEERCVAVACVPSKTMADRPVIGHLFGWFPPMPIEDNADLLVVTFSPELIADITEWLTDEQLDTYLGVVEMFLDGYIGAIESGTDTREARVRTESELFDSDPDALTLFSEIEARALDLGIVRLPG